MEKILVTGMTGLVGSAFAAELLRKRKDIHITALVRANGTKSAEDRIFDVLNEQYEIDQTSFDSVNDLKSRVDVFECDIANIPDDFSAKLNGRKINTIFHCAADVNLGKDPDGKTYRNNCQGTENIIRIGKHFSVESLHFVSTAYVSGRFNGPVMEDQLVEKPVFNNSYEKSKYHSEQKIRNSGIPYTIYRPSIIVGRRSDGKIRKPLAFYRILEFLAKIKKHFCVKNGLNPSATLDLPLRFESQLSENVYLVPVDFVQDTIYKLFSSPVSNKTFHITGKRPVSTKLIEETVQNFLRMPRIKVMNKVDNPSRTERMIWQFIGDLFPYFSSQMEFSVKNVSDTLGKDSLEWSFGKNELFTLAGSFYKSRFPELIT